MSQRSDSSVSDDAPSKRAGEAVESAVIQTVPELAYVPDRDRQHVDAVTTHVLDASPVVTFGGMCLLEAGTGVEIKSTMLEIGSGRRGRFQLRQQQHRALLEEADVYLFALCRPTYDRELIALKVVPASLVDELDWTWRQAAPGRETYAQIAWSQIWNPSDVDAREVLDA